MSRAGDAERMAELATAFASNPIAPEILEIELPGRIEAFVADQGAEPANGVLSTYLTS